MNNDNIIPVKIKKSNVSPLWFLTLIAGLLGGWLLYKSISEAGTTITIHFKAT